jgi:hypothetical protein
MDSSLWSLIENYKVYFLGPHILFNLKMFLCKSSYFANMIWSSAYKVFSLYSIPVEFHSFVLQIHAAAMTYYECMQFLLRIVCHTHTRWNCMPQE